jgi:hypothetical protein
MKKKLILLFSVFIAAFSYGVDNKDIDVQKVDFTGVNVSTYGEKFDFSEASNKFNLVFSAILPAGGIYLLTDSVTGKESVVQVGFSTIDHSPFLIYLPDYLYKFFTGAYDKKVDKLNLKIKFLGWNKTGEEAQTLDVQSLVVEPENSLAEINKNGKDKVYIQLGSYSFHQNAFPAITELLPYLEVKPHFYFIKKDIPQKDSVKSIYRILAGPYTSEDAKRITNLLNSSKKKSVFIQNFETILKEQKEGPKK